MRPDHAEAAVVCFWHHEWQEPAFQVYHGMLFGLPLAVTAFNRFSKLTEMLVRRLLGVLYSMYFDDATMQDWKSAAGSAQEAVGRLMQLLGSPFAPAKRQPMGPSADFLGLEHTVGRLRGAHRFGFGQEHGCWRRSRAW